MSVDTAQPESATSADDAHEAFLANSKRAGRRNAIPDPEIDSATIAQISEDVLPELAKQLSLSDKQMDQDTTKEPQPSTSKEGANG
ncbi:hypothetical protein RvY_15559-2 [Ramazzottius varieornatus]|uniref:Uncharacterized protein n=1 Tax=Ramazzottius varieornatus TaxID=947166 RepID=A0A1D1VWJ1_RAMVA|nr:hypothetical protein RvY_15559-2 [Ramazzottius varieornatus]